MSKLPWMPFYPADYLVDTAVLSLPTRGAWMDILCHLWRAVPRGTLTYPADAWAAMLRCSSEDFSTILAELSKYRICDSVTKCNADVTSDCNDLVTLISRRIVRDEKSRESTRLRVAKHRVTHPSNADVTSHSNGISNGVVQEHIRVIDHNQSQKSENTKKEKRPSLVSDADWLLSLKSNPAYHGLNIDRDYAKCQTWCQANRKTFSRRRLINWLNNADKPLTPTAPPARASRNLATLPD